MSKPKGKAKPSSADAAAATALVPSSSPATADPLSSLSIPALTAHLATLQSQLLTVRTNRNLLQQQAATLLSHHAELHRENETTLSHLHNVHSAVERLDETQQGAVRVFSQKVSHLQFEHQAATQSLQLTEQQRQRSLQQQHEARLQQLEQRMLDSQHELLQASLEDEEELKRARESQKKELSKLRDNFERSMETLTAAYSRQLQSLVTGLELRSKLEQHEIDERHNAHLNALLQAFSRSFADIKLYYQSITADNCSLIRELQTEIVDIKKSQEKKELSIAQLQQRHTEMTQPLTDSNHSRQQLLQQLQHDDKNKQTLAMLRLQCQRKAADLSRLTQRYQQMETEFAALYDEKQRLQKQVKNPRGKTEAFRAEDLSPALTEELRRRQEALELRRLQFASVVSASGLNARLVSALNERLDALLREKSGMVESLRYEVEKCKKGIDDMRRVMEAKLQGMGVVREKGTLDNKRLYANAGKGTAPADLVVQ